MRRPFPHRLALATLAIVVSCPSTAAIYRCQHNDLTVFADHPCGDDADTVTVEPVQTGGRLDTGTRVEFYRPPEQRPDTRSSTGCPAGYIQSSELRRMRVRKQVQEGLSQEQVRYIMGDPDHRNGQWWVYERQGRETGRFRFRQGCLVQWR
ncbi:MAG: hypothetical protein R3276_03195 [Marinobacter sp.]|nr:hypothetical protein [Marinobacter sp.]